MAEQKRVTRKGTRAMMRPKPRRVTGRDPYRPPLPTSDGGSRWYEPAMLVHDTLFLRHPDGFLFVDESYVPVEWDTVRPRKRYQYANLAHLKLVVKRRHDKILNFAATYGAGADQLRRHVTQEVG
jgi:hypothetical protein